MAQKQTTLTISEDAKPLVVKALQEHIETIVKLHTTCMKQKLMDAAKELNENIKTLEGFVADLQGKK